MLREIEADCDVIILCNPNMLVPWLLMAAYAYEVEADPILSDAKFDELARAMAANYDSIEHFHKHLIPCPEEGEPTVHIMILEKDYPGRVVGAVHSVRRCAQEILDMQDKEGIFAI